MPAKAPTLPIELSSQVRAGRYFAVRADKGRGYAQVCGGKELVAADYFLKRDGFPFWVLEYIFEGQGRVSLSGHAPVAMRAGSFFIYGPGVPHLIAAEGKAGMTKFFLAVRSETFPAEWGNVGLVWGKAYSLAQAESPIATLEQILAEGARNAEESAAVVYHLQQVLLLKLKGGMGRQDEGKPSDRLFVTMMEIIEQDFATIGTLRELAERIGVSPEYLCRRCKALGQPSPYQILLRKKMGYAAHLLRNGPWKVQEVARAVGFGDPFHFTRAFKGVMGMPPSKVYISR